MDLWFMIIQVPKKPSLSPLLVSGRQAASDRVQRPALHRCGKLRGDSEDAHQRACHGQEKVSDPGMFLFHIILLIVQHWFNHRRYLPRFSLTGVCGILWRSRSAAYSHEYIRHHHRSK